MDDSEARRPTILIVEDLDWIRAGMRRSVEVHGYRAVAASNLAEAVELTERESPVLILTEENFPDFDPLVEYVRKRRALRHVPVVIVNPDTPDGARHGDAQVLTSYEQIAQLITSPH